jgi:hypothetical protein
MGIFALLLGLLGGMCGVMGILTAADVVPIVMPEFTWVFWFWVAAILMLSSIASMLTKTFGD